MNLPSTLNNDKRALGGPMESEMRLLELSNDNLFSRGAGRISSGRHGARTASAVGGCQFSGSCRYGLCAVLLSLMPDLFAGGQVHSR